MSVQELNKLAEYPSDRIFSIGEVSELCGIEQHVLRYWEKQFTQLQKVSRRNGRRYYKQADVQFILSVKDVLYTQGMRISGARKFFDEKSVDQAVVSVEPKQQNVSLALEELKKAKAILKEE